MAYPTRVKKPLSQERYSGCPLSLYYFRPLTIFVLTILCSVIALTSSGCSFESGDPSLTRNTYLQLVDWHISGLWIINCPVAWVRVKNNNNVPIKNIVFQYNTYGFSGEPLNQGTHTIEESVAPGELKDFIELYLGLVDLESDKLSIKLISVSPT